MTTTLPYQGSSRTSKLGAIAAAPGAERKKPAMLRRRVFNSRNSACNVPMDWLDQSRWWTDAFLTDAWRYLHVEGHDKEDGRVFRVYPREIKGYEYAVRLEMKAGELFWLYNIEGTLGPAR